MFYHAPRTTGFAMLFLGALMPLEDAAATTFARSVVAYDPGQMVTAGDPSAALGRPGSVAGSGSQFASIISPFNPHYEDDQIVQFGEGGSITLRLSHFAITTSGTPEIGIFTNTGISDTSWPAGIAGSDLELPGATFGIDSALLEVSADGFNWIDLGIIRLDQPSSAFTNATSPYQSDPAGLTPANFGMPHHNELSDYSGKDWNTIQGLLGNSGGGTWIDLDPAGLDRVGWIRLSLEDDGNANTQLNFELDAVSVASSTVGGSIIPEPSVFTLICTLIGLLAIRHR
ncbi:MAG: hypothetical protein GY899_11785 [Verrucomicrobiaceae bacterium]|nr:hypothetical protein [Verrucomicrobiaceae bacterium]